MQRSTIGFIIGVVLGAAVVFTLPNKIIFHENLIAEQVTENSGDRFACPMLDFIGRAPGLCPVCGMKMDKVTAGALSREQMTRMGVELTTVGKGPAEITVHAAGLAEYDHRFTTVVIPRVSGRIVRRYDATFGCCTDVAADEPMIDLYSPEAFAAQGELKTAVTLQDKKLIDALRERFVRWNLTAYADKIIAGGEPLDTVTITTPVGGQVWLEMLDQVDEDLLVGREVKADEPLIRLINPQRMTMIVHIPETRADFVREQQAVTLIAEDRGPLTQVKAMVNRLAREIDPQTRTVEARIYISGASDQVRPGALITARFSGTWRDPEKPTEKEFILVPKSAVLSTGVRHVAWKAMGKPRQGKQEFSPASLWLGPRIEQADGNDYFIVRGGLEVGDRIATHGAFLIDAQAQLAGKQSLFFPVGAADSSASSAQPAEHKH
jgi:membrane fusion protein, copper/silver efflux system